MLENENTPNSTTLSQFRTLGASVSKFTDKRKAPLGTVYIDAIAPIGEREITIEKED